MSPFGNQEPLAPRQPGEPCSTAQARRWTGLLGASPLVRRYGRRPRRCCRRGRARRRRSSAGGTPATPRLMKHLCAQVGRCLTERSNGRGIWCPERHMDLPVGSGGQPLRRRSGDPEAQLVTAVSDGFPEVHEPTVAEYAEDLVIERRSSSQVAAVDAHMVDHGCHPPPGRRHVARTSPGTSSKPSTKSPGVPAFPRSRDLRPNPRVALLGAVRLRLKLPAHA